MKRSLALAALLTSACWGYSQTQRADSLLAQKATLDSLNQFFTYQDSLDIFELIDSLLKTEPAIGRSQMAVRLGYNSNVIADNRTFNIDRFGLAPGIAYYHKSGAYADVSSYWSQEYNPNFYLTVASVGYLRSFTKWYSLLGEYSRYFYNLPGDNSVSIPYTNNFGLTNYFEVKKAVLRLDYYFYFGDRTAHRILPNVGLNLVKKKWLGFDRVSIYPNTGIMFGSEDVTTTRVYPNPLLRLRLRQPLTYEETTTEFGVMNYSFSMPISMRKNNWTFLLNYTYNMPQPLPGEELGLQKGGFLSFAITRFFNF